MRLGQRLVGVELHAERPGESAAFYAWLLGPGSGGTRSSWMPVSLLFEHAVCGVHPTEPGGPPPSWVPVIAVDGEGVRERAAAEGMRIVDRHDRTYLVDRLGVWTRLVDRERLSPGVDPDAIGNTIAELNAPDPGETLAPYSRVLELELVEMLDDVADYHLLLDDGVLALGGLWYSSPAAAPAPAGLAGLLRRRRRRGDGGAGAADGGGGRGAAGPGGLEPPRHDGRPLRHAVRLLHLHRPAGLADAGAPRGR